MADEKPENWGFELPPPKVDTSKWADVEKAKPLDPLLVIAAARLVRANPEIWSIFTKVKPDKWISRDDGARMEQFLLEKFPYARFPNAVQNDVICARGFAMGLLRSHRETNSPKNLEDDTELINWLRNRHRQGILGGE